VFDEMSARDDFLNLSESFLWLDEDDSKYHGCLPWASLISFGISQNGAPNVS
jgi:hypothetical protein